jgi:hypothetical protein
LIACPSHLCRNPVSQTPPSTHEAFNPSTRQGIASITLTSDVPADWLRPGELVEILEGHKVVGVGSIVVP